MRNRECSATEAGGFTAQLHHQPTFMERVRALSLRRPSILLHAQTHFLLHVLGAGDAVAAGGVAVEGTGVLS